MKEIADFQLPISNCRLPILRKASGTNWQLAIGNWK